MQLSKLDKLKLDALLASLEGQHRSKLPEYQANFPGHTVSILEDRIDEITYFRSMLCEEG